MPAFAASGAALLALHSHGVDGVGGLALGGAGGGGDLTARGRRGEAQVGDLLGDGDDDPCELLDGALLHDAEEVEDGALALGRRALGRGVQRNVRDGVPAS